MEPSAMPEASLADHRLSRRRFLEWGVVAAGISLIPQSAVAKPTRRTRPTRTRRSIFHPPIKPPERLIATYNPSSRSFFQPVIRHPEKAVALYNTHTGESVNAIYWIQGKYLPETLSVVDRVLRDHRTDEIKPIDPQLLDLLFAISEELECPHPFYIISGYRSPETNAFLRFISRGVAEHSLHMDGKAVDIRIPGWASYTVRRTAMELRIGGVGYYPRADFVHVDVGPVRYW
jgi:uncharacterized protein YcbK (DUF882 family)